MASASADTAGRILVKKFDVNYYTQSGSQQKRVSSFQPVGTSEKS